MAERGAVLFDLDGTLVDSAADLLHAANALRARRGLDDFAMPAFRPFVSRGARAMLGAAIPGFDAQDEGTLGEFLQLYASAVAAHSRLFPGVAEMLDAIEARGLRWGIVTNKAEGLARPLCAALGLLERSGVLIGGDTLAERKPHPLPLLEACRRIDATPALSLYLGDDPRDIESAHAAGLRGIAVDWGYFDPAHPPSAWGAQRVLSAPAQLLDEALLRAERHG
ncbi:phosphoglycolate phosphatase [Aquimonas sp.]|uniref:phosphoglycolate phosphatase n=1 Tax=Aquimonas sp. TaxID=1872588 RepID=UPI0037C05496